MANIRQRGTNTWEFTVSLGKGPNNKYIRKTKTIEVTEKMTPKKLHEYLEFEYSKFKQELETGSYITPGKITFADFIDTWREKYAVNHLGTATLENYLQHLNKRVVPHIGHLKLEDIKPMHLVDLMDSLANGGRIDGREGKLSTGTVHYIHRAVRNVFSRAVEWRLIQSNPMDGVKKPKLETRDLDVYTKEETEKIFTYLEEEQELWRLLITLALTTGLRRGEILGLEWKHINFEAGTIDVLQTLSFTKNGYEIKEPKTKTSKRRLEVPASLLGDLKEYKKKCNEERLACADLWQGGEHFFVFNSWNGKPLNPYSVKTWWTRFTKRRHIRYINFHALRHTSATLLLNQGLHAKIIQARLGHANINTTLNIYTHALREADQAAASIFDSMLTDKKRNKA